MVRAIRFVLLEQLQNAGLPLGILCSTAIPGRRFLFHFVWRYFKLCVHVKSKERADTREDLRLSEKTKLATSAGWRVIIVDEYMIRSGEALKIISEVIKNAKMPNM